MQVFCLSTQGMLSVVLMDSTAMRDILTLDLQFERQTVLTSSKSLLRAAPRQGDAHYAGVVPGHGPT
jgi:hypothetical protein